MVQILDTRIVCAVLLLLIAGCSQPKKWSYEETISLKQINPLGITTTDNTIWISASKQKKVVAIDSQGNVLKEFTDLQRPMHIQAYQNKVYVPIYLEDKIAVINENHIDTLNLKVQPDAPAGVFVHNDTVAVADFYNHRIILQTDDTINTYGGKGHEKGQLFYPTDIEISGKKIFVADAYNHRVQIFDLDGNPLKIIGADQKINVATGLAVYDKQLFVTDFFNNRILIYDLNGNLIQTLSGHFNKPTDIGVMNSDIYVANFGDTTLVRYSRN